MKIACHSISALKSFIWRVMGVVVLAAVTYFFTRHWIITTKITFTHHAFFLIVFYLHERAWCHFMKPEGRLRNMVKAFIYEIILGMGFGGLIVFLYTGSFPMVTKVTGTYTIIKIIMYIIYDKVWSEFKKE
jgi:uncharacterized membrane protein